MVIIGIIGRKDKTDSGLLVDIMYNDISKAIRKSGGIPIGIRNNNILDYIDICDGFILQGGSEIDTNNYEVIKEIKKRDKPLLGICLGMQEMAMNMYDSDEDSKKIFDYFIDVCKK